ncbi:Hsp20/alpha crystallin family protein [Prevotella disiens]|jgi:hsp20/alpha crystallin family protein|uniref:Hsp20/alpha crystallin family protein n=4 Tax=Prevotella disiens TaxID=28130 RepID=A0A379DX23_9BACT|nr:Hsp20/alpha crystallin family protein [Prevotella disiens]EFL44799.1 Hsp20/alpha crystallin family protein [Prevotella disiens FB035-09AN]ERJ74986.1 Hsp20/alpha crystallin family protein [Prevotella disiens JCM 6334 = ATCC 29426]KGF50243.1 heat-shock protein [Prevotella disiens DNF00882]RGL02728.1 Hsp20/alpha crystallin family protein [Prevotella disiens]SUB84965.1 Nox16 [Prevotella disiens]
MYRNSWLPEVFNDFFYNNNMPKANATAPAINVLEDENAYTVELAAPGLCKEDFDISLNNEGDLVIKMEKKNAETEQKAHYLRREFAYSKYEQTLILPDDVDKDKIGAKMADGILNISLPKIQQSVQKVARQIEVG